MDPTKKNDAPGKARRQKSPISTPEKYDNETAKASVVTQSNGVAHTVANKTPANTNYSVVVTRHKSDHGSVSKSLTFKNAKLIASPTCQIWSGVSFRVALDDWRDFAKLIDQTPLDEAWSLGAMRADRADECEIFVKSAWATKQMTRRADVITRSRDLIDYAPGALAFCLLDFDAGEMTPENRQRLDELGGWFGAMRALLPGFDGAAYIWRPSTSANLYTVGFEKPLRETQNLHCYLLVEDGADTERFLKVLLDRAWLLGLGWIKVSRDGKALERGIVDASTWGGERLCFEGGPELVGYGLTQRDRHARIHDGSPYDTRRLLDLAPEEQSEVLRLKNAAKNDLGLKTRQESAAKKFKTEKVVELVKRGVSKERAERVVEALVGGVRRLMPDFQLELDDGRVITVRDILLDPEKFVGATMCDPIEGRERGRNVAFVMEQGNAIWSFACGETLYFFVHDFESISAAVEKAPEREAANVIARLLGDAVVTEAEKAALIKLAKQHDGILISDVRKVVKEEEIKRKKSDSKKVRDASKRPQIYLTPGAIVSVVMSVDMALTETKNVSIFRRGGDLVRPTEVDMPASDKRKTTVIGLKTFKAPDLSLAMAASADFYKPNKEGELVRCDPPINLAQKLIETGDRLHMPVIAGVISCPTLRPDGSVLSAPGYDAETGMYHFVDKAVDISSMKDEPDRDDALAALATLKELLTEFPFVNPVDKTVAISAKITAVCRAMFPVVPGHGCSAPEAGSGKSFEADLCSLIISGKDCPVLAACQNENEFEKQLSTALLSGCGLLSIDNRVEPLTGGLLCQAITQPFVTLRPFGQNEREVTVVNRITIQANGNNLSVSGDMTRRFLIGNLNAKMERPELRVFKCNPRAMILADRGKYVAACLTIVRAYLLAGHPGKLDPLASFEAWSDSVRSALVWLGEPDVVSTLDTARASDPEQEKLSAFVAAVVDCYGVGSDNAVTLRQMCRDALLGSYAGGDPQFTALSEALTSICRTSGADRFDTVRLGHWLRVRKDKMVGGHRLASVMNTHTKIASWFVESLAPPNA